jgi:hypothetical protein
MKTKCRLLKKNNILQRVRVGGCIDLKNEWVNMDISWTSTKTAEVGQHVHKMIEGRNLEKARMISLNGKPVKC